MKIFFTIQIDCESTTHSCNNPDLGERAIRGMGQILAESGTKCTFAVIPSDLKAHGAIYREVEAQGHEVGLHLHPTDLGYTEFMGVHSFEEQVKMLTMAKEAFGEVMGREPLSFTPGYGSANDHTYPALEKLGFRHGTVSFPTRDLPQCACIWGHSPLDVHYPHRYNRSLTGDVDFVEVPFTVDPDSRLWGGSHPQDLRVELMDAKNHWYTIHKAVKRQLAAGDAVPVKYLKVLTHNVFDYLDPPNFRRETLLGIIKAARQICQQENCEFVPATTGEIAAEYRSKVPLPKGGVILELDTRGWSVLKS